MMSDRDTAITYDELSVMDDDNFMHACADLLYPRGDSRRDPEPGPVVLGYMRSRLRGIADDVVTTFPIHGD